MPDLGADPVSGEALAADAAALACVYDGAEAEEIVEAALTRLFPGRVALVSSFGADAAVLLAMVADVDRATPVLFVDTGRHFPQTLRYRDTLVGRLGLTDVRSAGPADDEVSRRDPFLALAEQDPDACCALRKVAPLARALKPFDAWLSGRKRHQATTRARLALFEAEDGRIKVNPLAAWDGARILAYARRRGLPPHPLVAEGYPSIGCAPCTSPVAPGEDARAGRWRGHAKTECGIHRPPASPGQGR